MTGKSQFDLERRQATALSMGTPNILETPDIDWPWPFNTF
jgi:hypothetical protein